MAAATSTDPVEKGKRTIVHEILESNLPPAEKIFPRVFTEVASVSSAGYETTASVLRLIIFHIFSNTEILQRLRAELTPVSTRDLDRIELKALERLPYLTSVLMEGMRLSPAIASRMARIAPDRELMYEDWRIPPGTPVGMTTLLMHTDESLYPDPMRFNPDRWMDTSARKKMEKTYAPFSKGTRNCVGMYLAWAEMYLVLAALVQSFDFRFEGVTAKDFECISDQFIIGTKAGCFLDAFVIPCKS